MIPMQTSSKNYILCGVIWLDSILIDIDRIEYSWNYLNWNAERDELKSKVNVSVQHIQ